MSSQLFSSTLAGAGTFAASDALDAAKLEALPERQIVPFLAHTANFLRSHEWHDAHAPQKDAGDVGNRLRVFVKALLGSSALTASTNPDTAQLVASILCDAVRLHSAAAGGDEARRISGGPGAAAVASLSPLPFPPAATFDVLRLVTRPFRLFCEAATTAASGDFAVQRCGMAAARGAASRVLLHLVPNCLGGLTGGSAATAAKELDAALQHLFSCVPLLSGGGGGGAAASLAGDLSRILGDAMEATNAVTAAQLQPLLDVLVAASPALRPPHQQKGATGSTSATTSPGVAVASRVLLEQVDVIQPALAAIAVEYLEQGMEKLLAADMHAAHGGSSSNNNDNNNNAAAETAAERQEAARRRRPALRDLSRAVEVFVAAMELSPALCSHLVPALAPHLSHDSADVRLLLLRGFSAAWASNAEAFPAYRSAFTAALSRFNDVRPAVRVEAVEAAGRVMGAAARGGWPLPLTTECWSVLRPCLDERLTDLHVAVRTQAVLTYADILDAAPTLATTTTTTGGDEADGERRGHPPLAATLGLRTADKNARVRERAVERLSALYRHHPAVFSWVPDSVVSAARAEAGGVRLVESALEALLPPLKSPAAGRAPAPMAVFDFEVEGRQEKGPGGAYVDAVVRLCRDMGDQSFTQVIAIARNKPQLRRAVARLFEMRAQFKAAASGGGGSGGADAQQLAAGLRRLLSFLQDMTGAARGEWDRLFRAKDDRVAAAFLRLCREETVNWVAERDAFVAALKGRVEADVFRFVTESLVGQLVMPVDAAHLLELLDRVGEATRPAAVARGGGDGDGDETQALLRALLLFTTAAPALLPRCTHILLRSVATVATATGGAGGAATSSSSLLLLLQLLQSWAAHAATAAAAGASSSVVAPPRQEKLDALAALRDLCLGGRAARALAAAAGTDSDADTDALAKVTHAAAQTLVSLVAVPSFGEAGALERLVDALAAKLQARAEAVAGGAAAAKPLRKAVRKAARRGAAAARDGGDDDANSDDEGDDTVALRTVAWLVAVASLAESAVSAPLVQDERLVAHVAAVALAAAADATDRREHAQLPRRATLPEKTAQLFAHTAVASAATEAGATALASVALSHAADRRPGAVTDALAALLRVFKASAARAGGTGSVGSAQRRLAICRQLVRLVATPTTDIGKELAVAVLLSVEEEEPVLMAVQQSLSDRLTREPTDMRFAALLLLTAIACDGRSFAALRARVAAVGAALRSRQAATRATLSDAAAMQCYLEYTIPFLVLFMTHHTLYESERATNGFIAFQRVWHLLFEELFRHGTQCASFVAELLSRIKAADSAVDAGSDAHRVLCDLCSRVMLECLGQRQTAPDALRRFPGAVLLPSFYTRSRHSSPQAPLNTVYLDPAIVIASSAPFRVPVAATGAGAGGGVRSASASVSRSSATPRHSTARPTADPRQLQLNDDGTNDVDADADAAEGEGEGEGRRVGGGRKRPRRRSSSLSVSPSPSPAPSRVSHRTLHHTLSDSNGHSGAGAEAEEAGADNSDNSGSGLGAQTLSVIDGVLAATLKGLRRAEIAQLRWKAVKAAITAAVGAGGAAEEEAAVLDYAREQLRQAYEDAKP